MSRPSTEPVTFTNSFSVPNELNIDMGINMMIEMPEVLVVYDSIVRYLDILS